MSSPDQPTPPSGWGEAPRPPEPRYGQYGEGRYGQGQYGAQPGPGQDAPTPPGAQPPPAQHSPYRPSPYGPAATKPGIVPLRPLSLGEIYDGAFGAVRHNPAVVLGVVTLIVAVATVLATLLAQLAVPFLTGVFADLSGDPSLAVLGPDLGMFAQLMAVSGALSLTLLVAQPIAEGVVTVSVSQSVIGRKLRPGQVWARLRPRIGVLIGWMLVRTVGIFVGVAVLVFGFALLVAGVANVTGSTGATILVGLLLAVGVAALCLWLAVRIVLVVPALVLENGGFGSTIARAWRLTRRNYWRILGTYLLASIIAGLVSQVVAYPLGLVGMSIDSASSTSGVLALGWGTLLTSLVASVIGTLVVVVFVSGVVALVYTDVRMRREGLDVSLAQAAARDAGTVPGQPTR